MDRIDQLIKWCEENNTRKEYISIKARLKMIKVLCEELNLAEDSRFIEEIIDAFSEIIAIQQEIIDDMKMECDGYSFDSSTNSCYIRGSNVFTDNDLREDVLPAIQHSYLPSKEGFQTDKQLAKGFTNYLQYHNTKKLSKFTAYDYCSRVKNLWNLFLNDVDVREVKIFDDSPMLNVYNNINVVIRSLSVKLKSLERGTSEFKNLSNASAALNKFAEFKYMVENSK